MSFQPVGNNAQYWLRELANLERLHPTTVHQPAKNTRRALGHLVLLEEALADPEIYDELVIQRRFLAVEGYAKEALGLNRAVPEQLEMLRLAPNIRAVGLAWHAGRPPLETVQELRRLRKPLQNVIFSSPSPGGADDVRHLYNRWNEALSRAQTASRQDHGLRRCCMHLALLEEHLTDGEMYCADCIRKHYTAAAGYARAGGSVAVASAIDKSAEMWRSAGSPDACALQLSVLRTRLQPQVFGIGVQA